jgi:hypothetical protein
MQFESEGRAIVFNGESLKKSWNIDLQTVKNGHSELREESLRDLPAEGE